MKIKLNINGKEIEAEISEQDLRKVEGVESGRVMIGDSYFAVGTGGGVGTITEDGTMADAWRFVTGNYFFTEDEAQEYHDYLEAVGQIKQYIRENGMSFVPDWGDRDQNKYFLFYDHALNRWDSNSVYGYQDLHVLPFLSSTEHAVKVIENCAPQLEVARKYLAKNK